MLRHPFGRLLFAITLFTADAPLLAQGPLRAGDLHPTLVSRGAGLRAATNGDGLLGAGADYRARFTASGMRFEPALGRAVATTQHLALTPLVVQRGGFEPFVPVPVAPREHGLAAVYDRAPGVHERFDVGPDGVELSWHFAAPLPGDGDLVVRYAIDTSLPAPRAEGDGLAFELPSSGGVRIGGVTGIDANGARCRGTTRWVAGQLELVLPGAFVAAARYPLVLDPTVGAVLQVNVPSSSDGNPDVAFDAGTGRYLVVWRRYVADGVADVRGQLVSSSGSLFGPMILFGSAGNASLPRVANLGSRGRFGVVWSQVANGTGSVQFESVAAAGGITHSLAVATSPTLYSPVTGIGAETASTPGADRDFVVAWTDGPSVRTRRVWFTLSDAISAGGMTTVFTGQGATVYEAPAIARTAGGDGMLLVVARCVSSPLPDAIVAAAVPTFATIGGTIPTVTVASAWGQTFDQPAVDGYGARWIVAWHRAGGNSNTITTVPLQLGGSALFVGAAHTLTGPPGFTASNPTVGYSFGKAWLGYYSTTLLGAKSLALRGIDATTCVPGSDYLSVAVTQDRRIVATTELSGGSTTGDGGCAVWAVFGDVFAQRLVNHGNGGSIQDLGGGCGAGSGTQSFNHNPAIGSAGFVCSVQGLPAATPTVFNFSEVVPTVSCGPCIWVPFSITVLLDSGAGSASVQFPIPYRASLVGAQFETQWTSLNGSQTPCSTYPGVVLSGRTRLVLGQ